MTIPTSESLINAAADTDLAAVTDDYIRSALNKVFGSDGA